MAEPRLGASHPNGQIRRTLTPSGRRVRSSRYSLPYSACRCKSPPLPRSLRAKYRATSNASALASRSYRIFISASRSAVPWLLRSA
jgi:hypothetical protein